MDFTPSPRVEELKSRGRHKQIVLPVLITSGSTASHCPTCALPM